MTRIAVPFWKDRISPVFDTARSALIVTVEEGVVTHQSEMRFFPDFPARRVRALSERGVSVLICGAISRRLSNMCTGAGMNVIPWICGEVDQVLAAYLRDDLSNPHFVMPGCCGRRRRAGGRGGQRGIIVRGRDRRRRGRLWNNAKMRKERDRR